MKDGKTQTTDRLPNRKNRRRSRSSKNLSSSHRPGPRALLLVGNLKVGKSSLYDSLVGKNLPAVTYPGTRVELPQGTLRGDRFNSLVDSPGFHSLQDRSEDARVVRDLLVRRRVGGLLLVLDAKNLRRGLALVLQVSEYGLPVVIALNMADEAMQRGLTIDSEGLSASLGVPIVSTVAMEGQGLSALRKGIEQAKPLALSLQVPEGLQEAWTELVGLLAEHPFSAEGLAYQLLADLPGSAEVLDDHLDPDIRPQVDSILQSCRSRSTLQLDIAFTHAEQAQADAMVQRHVKLQPPARTRMAERLAAWSRRPLTGIPIVLLVLFAVYTFVGWFGATFLVDLIEGKLYGEVMGPSIESWVAALPDSMLWLRELLIGRFGLITVGLVLPLAIVLPVLATFFFSFALIEDSGYLPRMSLLLDRMLRKIGLNGKGLLPLVMGFSCVTMAILTTRMLDTRKQRIISTLLLMVAMPCAPMLGVMMVLLSRLPFEASLTLFGLVFLQIGLVGVIANLLLPGRRPDFVIELPPLRVPRVGNILSKTGHRLFWFMREAIPFFVIGSLALFFLDQLGLVDWLRQAAEPLLVRFMGLPPDSADVFLMSFIRREAGAALLVHQVELGMYDGVQAVVTLLVMILLVPCINALLVMYKERGLLVGSAILLFVVSYAFAFGALTHTVLRALEVQF